MLGIQKQGKVFANHGTELGNNLKKYTGGLAKTTEQQLKNAKLPQVPNAVKDAAKELLNSAPKKFEVPGIPQKEVDPVQRQLRIRSTDEKKPKQESVSISDYRQKILEERLVKLTIGFTK